MLQVGKVENNQVYRLALQPITAANVVKDLGVFVHKHLKFDEHIRHIGDKCYGGAYNYSAAQYQHPHQWNESSRQRISATGDWMQDEQVRPHVMQVDVAKVEEA